MRPLITVAFALKRPCAMAGCASQTSDKVSKRPTELCTRKNHHSRHTRTSDRQPPRLQLPRGAQTSDATPAIPSEVGRTIRQACMLLRLRKRRDVRGSRLTLEVSGPLACWRVSPTCQMSFRRVLCVPPGQQQESWTDLTTEDVADMHLRHLL